MYHFADKDVEIAILSKDAISNIKKGVRFTCVAFTLSSSTLDVAWIQNSAGDSLTGSCYESRNFTMGKYIFNQLFLTIRSITCEHNGAFICNATDNSYVVNSVVNLYLKSEFFMRFNKGNVLFLCFICFVLLQIQLRSLPHR